FHEVERAEELADAALIEQTLRLDVHETYETGFNDVQTALRGASLFQHDLAGLEILHGDVRQHYLSNLVRQEVEGRRGFQQRAESVDDRRCAHIGLLVV